MYFFANCANSKGIYPIYQAVLKEVPPDAARELCKAKAEGEQERKPEVVCCHLKQQKTLTTNILEHVNRQSNKSNIKGTKQNNFEMG